MNFRTETNAETHTSNDGSRTIAANWSQLDWARFLCRHGAKAILLQPGTKIPLEKGGWQSPYQTFELFEAAYANNPDCNVGIVCDGDLVGIDIDNKPGKPANGFASIAKLTGVAETAEEAWELEEVLETASTLMVKTPNDGVHPYYKGSHTLSGCNGSGKLEGVDLRAGGRHYLVCPGAQLSDGGRYEPVFHGNTPVIGKIPKKLLKALSAASGKQQKKCKEVVSRQRGKPVCLDDFTEVMRCYDPTVYDDWMRVGFVTRNALIWDPATEQLLDGGDAGTTEERKELFDRWSHGQVHEPPLDVPNYGRIDEFWDSADGDALGFGGLFFVARERQPNRFPKGLTSCLLEVLESGKLSSHAKADILDNISEADLAVLKVNERFALVTGGDLVGQIIETSDPFKPRIIKAENFTNIWRDQWVTIGGDDDDPKKKRLCDLWRDSPDKRKYTGVMFQPPVVHPDSYQAKVFPGADAIAGPPPDDVLNTWNGFAVEPKTGNAHEPLLIHIRDNICNENEELYHWFISFMADMVQCPGRKPGVAAGIRGGQGVGKSVITEYLMKIFGVGRHAFKTASDDDVIGDKNGALQSLIVCILEEAIWAGNPKARGKLKDLITAEAISVRQLYRDPVMLANHMRMMVITNEAWMTHVDMDDRRWCIIEACDPWRGDVAARMEYFGPIQKAKNEEGPACLLHYLLKYEYSPDDLAMIPRTQAKTEQQKQSMGSVDAFLYDVLTGEHQVQGIGKDCDDLFGNNIAKVEFFSAYRVWKDSDPRAAVTRAIFGRRIRDVFSQTVADTRPTVDGQRPNSYQFSGRRSCQEEFARFMKCPVEELFP